MAARHHLMRLYGQGRNRTADTVIFSLKLDFI